ncbi:hypothetical protein MBH78_07975 [Oceanimonas sp. NS1]|nr:hypothetical protein [Oceanimonas sp. NS1]
MQTGTNQKCLRHRTITKNNSEITKFPAGKKLIEPKRAADHNEICVEGTSAASYSYFLTGRRICNGHFFISGFLVGLAAPDPGWRLGTYHERAEHYGAHRYPIHYFLSQWRGQIQPDPGPA